MLPDTRLAATLAPTIVPPRPPDGRRKAGKPDPRVAALCGALDALTLNKPAVAAFSEGVGQLRDLGVGLVVPDGESVVLTAAGSAPLTLAIDDARRAPTALRRWLGGLD